jgi:hypothetical protein
VAASGRVRRGHSDEWLLLDLRLSPRRLCVIARCHVPLERRNELDVIRNCRNLFNAGSSRSSAVVERVLSRTARATKIESHTVRPVAFASACASSAKERHETVSSAICPMAATSCCLAERSAPRGGSLSDRVGRFGDRADPGATYSCGRTSRRRASRRKRYQAAMHLGVGSTRRSPVAG